MSSILETSISTCGFGMTLPGGVRDADSSWKLLCNTSRSGGRCKVPKHRYNFDAFCGPGKLGHFASEYGYVIDDINVKRVDASFWSMSKEEIAAMDPLRIISADREKRCPEHYNERFDKNSELWSCCLCHCLQSHGPRCLHHL